MSFLKIYLDTDFATCTMSTDDAVVIGNELKKRGIRFERWPTRELADVSNSQAILDSYAPEVEKLKAENGFQTADVVSLTPDHPERVAFRQKFLDEHRHSEDEVRFFVRGHGLFYLHLGNEVLVVLCCENDLISVPAGTTHWFDMGPEPDFTAVRLFTNPEGWVAQFTGSDIASRAPRYEALVGVAE